MKLFLFFLLFVALFSSCDLTETPDSEKAEMLTFGVLFGGDTIQGNIHDSVIEIYYPDSAARHSIPVFSHTGETVSVLGVIQTSGVDSQHFTNPVIYIIRAKDSSERAYSVTVKYFNELPLVYIDTKNVQIADKVKYIPSTITIDGNPGTIKSYSGGLRGRGNSTWLYPWEPKNPYKIKFDDKQSVFGFPSDKEWALLANWFDKSLLRNDVGFEMSERLQRAWTPRRKSVDLFLNNRYNGSYLLTETVKAGNDRVNISKTGWLIEVNHNAPETDPRFYIGEESANLPVDVKEGSVKAEEIKKQVDTLYNLLQLKTSDPLFYTYVNYFDIDSYVTWFLVNEISVNNDASFYSSVYLQKDAAGQKIKMGPVWDVDLSSGNNLHNTDDLGLNWRLANAPIGSRIFLDTAYFRPALKAKWNQYREQLMSIPDYILAKGKEIELSGNYDAQWWLENFKGDRHSSRNPNPSAFQSEVEYLHKWYSDRLAWFDVEVKKL